LDVVGNGGWPASLAARDDNAPQTFRLPWPSVSLKMPSQNKQLTTQEKVIFLHTLIRRCY
jgi:hypothetical protein